MPKMPLPELAAVLLEHLVHRHFLHRRRPEVIALVTGFNGQRGGYHLSTCHFVFSLFQLVYVNGMGGTIYNVSSATFFKIKKNILRLIITLMKIKIAFI